MQFNIGSSWRKTAKMPLGERGNSYRQLLPIVNKKNITIATGSPYSGWQNILPILEEAGLDSANDAFMKWHDDFFDSNSISNPSQLAPAQQMHSKKNNEKTESCSEENTAAPLLLVDNRSLLLLDYWAAALPQAHFLLFYTCAETSVAHACQHGIDLHQLMDGWQAAVRQLLTFRRRHRKRAILLDAEAAARNPQMMMEVCEEFGISFQRLPEASGDIFSPPPIERLLAREFVTSLPEIRGLQAEIEVSSQPIGDDKYSRIKLADLYNDYQLRAAMSCEQQGKLAEANKKLESTKNSNEDHQKKEIELQGRVDELLLVSSKEAKQNIILNEEIEREKKKRAKLEKRIEEAIKENDLMLRQLHEVQEGFEKSYLSSKELALLNHEYQVESSKQKAKSESLKAHVSELKAQVASMREDGEEQSKKMADLEVQSKQKIAGLKDQISHLNTEINGLTGQVRRDGEQKEKSEIRYEKLFSKCKAIEESNDNLVRDNELLLEQIHLIQKELEEGCVRNLNLKSAYRQIENSKEKVLKDNEVLSNEMQSIKEALAIREGEAERLANRVENFKNAVTWKITAPLRAMARPFATSTKDQKKRKDIIKLLKASGHFDEAYYISENEDVAKDGMDPVEHYVSHGAKEGRNPSPSFNTQRYLDINPDVAETGMNPLLHYVQYGIGEGRVVSNER